MRKQSLALRYCGMVAVVLAFLPFSLTAGNMGDNITINGFGHQSMIQTDDNEYITEESSERSYNDYVLGLTIGAEVNERVNVQAQILNTQEGFGIDWGFANYSINESIGLRFGKVKLPMGLYNEFVDVKSLQPFSYLPTLIYGHGMTSYNGAGFSGSVDFQNDWAGQLDVYGGQSQMNNMKEMNVEMKNAAGGRASITTPIPGSRLAFSYLRSDMHMVMKDAMGMSMETVVASEVMVVSGEVVGNEYFVRGEYGSFTATEDKMSWYGEAGYLVTEYLQPVVRYIHQESNNTPQLTLAARQAIGQTSRQNEIGVGINVFLASAIVLKLEHHWIDGSSQLDTNESANSAPDNSWNLTAISAAFTF